MRNSESSFKWFIGILIAFLAAGSGIVALLTYFNPSHQQPPMSPPSVNTSNAPSNTPPGTCIQGYVWREASPTDHVCVTPNVRDQAAYDNSQASARRNPNGGPYGPDTCLQGYVWREAFPNDHVCVTPETRAQAQYDNSQAQSRIAP